MVSSLIMQCFVLAGGFATRLWPLTEQRAKPLLPLAGRPIISHLVDRIPHKIPVTVSTNAAFGDAFHDWRPSVSHPSVEVVVEHTRSDDEKLGALGAVAQWITEQNIDDDLFLLTGDNYIGFDLHQFIDHFSDSPLIATHDIGDFHLARHFGTVITDGDRVTAFDEKPENPRSSLIATGLSILPRSLLPVLVDYAKRKPDNVGGIFEELLQKGNEIHAVAFTEPWFDIGSFDAYLDATRTLVGDAVLRENNVTVDNSHFSGSVVLGSECIVENSTLENVVVFGSCTLRDVVLRDCILDEDCALSGVDLTHQMLRKGTKLARTSSSL